MLGCHKWIKLVFMAWHRAALQNQVGVLKHENEELRKLSGPRKESIWNMKRTDLEEVARKELNMSGQEIKAETVTTLREKIRAERDKQKQEQDPFAQLPVRLERMRHEELVNECWSRSLDPTAVDETGKGKQKYKTRPQMILMIREDVEVRKLDQTQDPKAGSQPPRGSSSRMSTPPADTDWEMSESFCSAAAASASHHP